MGLIAQGKAAIPVRAATSAGDKPNSSLRKKLTAKRDIPKIPWTA